jgi:hypothetical protein
MPWVIRPWQIAFSPSGASLLLLTIEGPPDQQAIYSRLFIYDIIYDIESSGLNIENEPFSPPEQHVTQIVQIGRPAMAADGSVIARAAWLDSSTIAVWEFDDDYLTSTSGHLRILSLPLGRV